MDAPARTKEEGDMENQLSMQYIMDGSGHYYRVNGNNQLVVADGREDASVFTFSEANQRIGNGKKAKFYQTIPVESSDRTSEVDCEGVQVQSNVIAVFHEENSRADEKGVLEYNIEGINWLEYMNLFCYLSNTAKNYQDELAAKQSTIDKEICDLLHYIELYDLTAEEEIHAVELLKDARERRRDIKDEMVKVEQFSRSIGTSANVAKAKGCIKEIKKLERRIYRPRELPELFSDMESRKTDRHADKKPLENGGEEERMMDYCRRETIYDGKETNWLELAKGQRDFFTDIRQYMVNLELELDDIERTIEEILFEIEDAKYNVTQGYKAFKELKDLRNVRKDKIQELEQIQTITDCFDCEAMADIYQYAVDAIEGMTVSQNPDMHME